MHDPEISRGRIIIDRWRVLAEARLDHLTELYESGRWRRYFTEQAFLENIREAKVAAETWRMLASQESLSDNTPLDLSWLDAKRPVPVTRPRPIELPAVRTATPADAAVSSVVPLPVQSEIRITPRVEIDHPPARRAEAPSRPAAPASDWTTGLDLTRLKQRYSLLRDGV